MNIICNEADVGICELRIQMQRLAQTRNGFVRTLEEPCLACSCFGV